MEQIGAETVLCETCLERGRERAAEIVTEGLQMCGPCFNGKPTCRAETVGGRDPVRERAARKYQEKNRQKVQKRMRRWRKENAERVSKYQRRYHSDRELSRMMLGKSSELGAANSEL